MTSAQQNANGSRGGAGLPPVPSIPLTEDGAARVAGESSIGGLVRDATTHVSTLIRAEVELAKQEVTGEIKKGIKGSLYFIVALTIGLFSLFFFFFMLAQGIHALGLNEFFSFLIVWGLMLAMVVLFVFLGVRKLKKIRAPQRTISTLQDTAAALRHRDQRADEHPAY
ncbi:phage holin family protein [Solihabitans fulvus]|uniref:Phage holin family protein n=1 Tax=Solihabitans fulvus TaxID=1892852 RepID=A0A5B2XHI8_9PSEU|nr:phage holin family protein [Solihabitans fulvus]KAA2262262.1 phage holin family protein [Solihabitans fulvus]